MDRLHEASILLNLSRVSLASLREKLGAIMSSLAAAAVPSALSLASENLHKEVLSCLVALANVFLSSRYLFVESDWVPQALWREAPQRGASASPAPASHSRVNGKEEL